MSTVRGQLRPGVGVGELLRATFPPASVTGAPKPRVLQIIEDLEPVPRGVYCGAFGWIDTGTATGDLAVAIRTFTVAGDDGAPPSASAAASSPTPTRARVGRDLPQGAPAPRRGRRRRPASVRP